jgi:hypothetical protein
VALLVFACKIQAQDNPIPMDPISWVIVENRPDCKYLNSVTHGHASSKWSGRCAGGFVQGQGTMTYDDELGHEIIVGEFDDGIINGYGEFSGWIQYDSKPMRYEYKGDFLHGSMTGRGTIITANEFIYSGALLNANPYGYGELKSKNRSYVGIFNDWAYDGLGILRIDDQILFTGQFRNGEADGAGVLEISGKTFDFKLRLVGVFKGEVGVPFDKLNVIGPGILEVENTHKYKYTGEFKGIKMHGYGVQVYDTGMRYEGLFEDDRRNGRGIAIAPNGDTCEGEWVGGQLVGLGKGHSRGKKAPCEIDTDGTLTFTILK